MRTLLLVPASLLLLTAACVAGEDDPPGDSDPPAGLTWYTTCGDPVCGGYSGPYPGVDACTDQVEGEPCSEDAATCDFQSDCNATLVCAAEDPKDQVGGCPISKAEVKTDITYLDRTSLTTQADAALGMKLATWRYNWETPADKPHLGFIIDDAPDSAAVRGDGERVDLYGYTSLTLAAIQVQQAQIEALQAEVAALRSQVGECAKP